MVGRTASLLSPLRAAALAAALAALVAWNAGAGVFPEISHWPDVLVVACLVMPVTFAVPWLALPLAESRSVVPIAGCAIALTVLCDLAGLASLFNVAKLIALTAIGYLFMQVFEALSWVVVIALLIPWVDAISVWRGPTDYVVTEQPGLFERVAIAFRLPGEEGYANIGPPDILFFALFLATAARYGLRVGWTWLAMVGLLVVTLLLTTSLDVTGLPALPAIAFGFLLPNVDLIWRAWRERGLELRRDEP